MDTDSAYVAEEVEDGETIRTYWRCEACPMCEECSDNAWTKVDKCSYVSREACMEKIAQHLIKSGLHFKDKDMAMEMARQGSYVELQETPQDRAEYRLKIDNIAKAKRAEKKQNKGYADKGYGDKGCGDKGYGKASETQRKNRAQPYLEQAPQSPPHNPPPPHTPSQPAYPPKVPIGARSLDRRGAPPNDVLDTYCPSATHVPIRIAKVKETLDTIMRAKRAMMTMQQSCVNASNRCSEMACVFTSAAVKHGEEAQLLSDCEAAFNIALISGASL
jgi:hypothetical protein